MTRNARHPNLFVIGAMKSGTSSFHSYLDTHPQIFMSPVKEPFYFVHEDENAARLDWYLSLFEGVKDEIIIGESSTHYTIAPRKVGVPQRIAAFHPNPYLIYIMRDPVERIISQYWFHRWKQREPRDMQTAIREKPDYVDFSNYALQLSLYHEVFGKDAVKVVTFEQLKADPVRVMGDVYQWLGVDASHTSPRYFERRNVTPTEILPFGRTARTILFSKAVRSTVRTVFPRSLRQRLKRQLSTPVDRTSENVEQVKAYLRPILRPQVEELSRMLDREFPEWTTLYED